MKRSDDDGLGAVKRSVGNVQIHERGLMSSGWTGSTVLPWARLRSIYYYGVRETHTLLFVPIFTTESKKLTLVGDDGTQLAVRGDDADAVYDQALAATQERFLAEAAARLRDRQTVSFDKWHLTRDDLTYPSHDWGKPRTVPWSTVTRLQLNNGEVELHEQGKTPQKRLFLPDNFDLVIAKAYSVPNLQLFLQLGRDLACASLPGPGKDCPACGGRVRLHARFCRHDGHLIPADFFSPPIAGLVSVMSQWAPGTVGGGGGMTALFPQLSSLGQQRLMEFFTDAAFSLAPERLLELFAPATAEDVRRIAESLNSDATAASDPRPPSPAAAPTPAAPQTAADFANLLNTAAPEQVQQLSGSLNAAENGGAVRAGEWPKSSVLVKRCGTRADAEAICKRMGRFKAWIASARLATLPEGVQLRITTRVISEDAFRELCAALKARL